MALGSYSNSGLSFGLTFRLIDAFTTPSRQIERQMARLSGASDAMALSVERSMSGIRTGVGMVLVALASLAFFVKAAKIDAQFQRYETAFATFTGSAIQAKEVFDKITKDAIDNPYFQVEGLQKANMMLISQGLEAEKSMRMVKNLGVVLAGVGGGDAELNRIAVALEKMKAKGTLDPLSERSFIHARLPLIRMMEDAYNKPYFALKKQGITIDMLDKALAHATSKTGAYGNVTANLFTTQYAKMQQMAELATVAMSKIGQAIRPTTAAFMDKVIVMLNKIMEFVQTPAGAAIANMALKATALWLVLGLLSIAIAANTLLLSRFASLLPAAGKLAVMTTLSTRGLAAAFGQLALQFIKVIPAMLPGAAVLASIVGVIYSLSRAYTEFSSLMAGKSGIQGGAIGFFQKLGGLMHVVLTAFSTYNKQSRQFVVPTDLINTLDSLGIGNTARGLFTWIAGFIESWYGFVDGIKAGWAEIKQFLLGVLSLFGISDTLIQNVTSNLDTWRAVGYRVGKTIMMIAYGWMILKGLQLITFMSELAISIVGVGIQLALLAAKLVMQAILWAAVNFEMLTFNAIALLTIAAIGIIIYGISQMGRESDSAFQAMKRDVAGYQDALGGVGSQMGGYGFTWANDLRTNWDKRIEGWNPFQPLIDGWNDFKKGLDEFLRYLPLIRPANNFTEEEGKRVKQILAGQDPYKYSKPGSLSPFYAKSNDAAVSAARARMSQGVAGYATTAPLAGNTSTAATQPQQQPIVVQLMLEKQLLGEVTWDYIKQQLAESH